VARNLLWCLNSCEYERIRHRQWSAAYFSFARRDAVPGGLQSFQLDFNLPRHYRSLCASAGLFLSTLSFVLVLCIAVSAVMRRRFHCRYHEYGYHWVCRSLRKGHDVIYLVRNGRIRVRVPDSLRLSPYRPCYLFRLDCAPECGVICLGSDRRNRK
jgi:hypothetical protein